MDGGFWFHGAPAIIGYFGVAPQVISASPLNGGDNYLNFGFANSESTIRRCYTNKDDLDVREPHIIEFDIRLDDCPLFQRREALAYQPLRTTGGTPMIVRLAGEETLRLTSVNSPASDQAYVNFILLLPVNLDLALKTPVSMGPRLVLISRR